MAMVKKLVPDRARKKFERVDLVSNVTEWIRKEILSGKLAVGSKLPAEGKLAEEFGVSRNVLREAMRNLRAMGLIEISQGRAPRVKASDPETAVMAMESILRDSDNKLLHLTEVRYAIEVGIVILACKRRTNVDLDKLKQCLEQLKQAAEQDIQIEKDYEFHRLLADATRNPVYTYIFEALSGLIKRSQQITYPHDGLLHAISGHSAIYKAVAEQDEIAAAEAMRRHLKDAEADLLAG
ncbi:MAG: FadR family transcriptional regulator [Victivallales bacterium]|nr:FadR family transcriptional regulator [Victivallales bacterium]